jgi:sorbitol-specific phosphotransferase system component IIC
MAIGVRDQTRAALPAYGRLRIFNITVAAVLAVQAAYMLVAGNGLSLPVTATFLRGDPITARPGVAETLFGLGIAPAVAVFLLLAALDHALVASPSLHRLYERGLDRRINYARWIEYSISASIMIVLVAMFTGIRDVAALSAIFAANSAMILFGLLMERQQRPGSADWTAFWCGSVVGLVPWGLIALYVSRTPSVPGFVYGIIVLQFVLFFSFAANMALQYARVGRWRNYLHGEVTYIVLSLTAKSLLAWLIFANVLRS